MELIGRHAVVDPGRAAPVLVTGAGGTLGRVLCRRLAAAGRDLVPWDRAAWSPLDPAAPARCLDSLRPAAVFHLAIASSGTGADNEGWRVNVEWPEALARAAAERGIPLVFTSTAMVFSDTASGPFTVDSLPDRADGYGMEKRLAEARVRAAHPDAVIARLGWQIGTEPEGNNMLAFLAQRQREDSLVRASTRWYPACSFIEETARALAELPEAPGGLYHLDANERWTFFEIATALAAFHPGLCRVEADEAFIYDQRLVETRPAHRLAPLSRDLPALP